MARAARNSSGRQIRQSPSSGPARWTAALERKRALHLDGEARNGGFPDWLLFKKADGADNPNAASNLKTDMARCNVEPPADNLPSAELQSKIDAFFKMMEGKKFNLKVTHTKDKSGKTDEKGEVVIYENVNIRGFAN